MLIGALNANEFADFSLEKTPDYLSAKKIKKSIEFELKIISKLLNKEFIKAKKPALNISQILKCLSTNVKLQNATPLDIDLKIEPQIRAYAMLLAIKKILKTNKNQNFCLLYKQSARARIYFENLKQAGILPSFILVLKKQNEILNEAELAEFKKLKIAYEILECESVNDDVCFNKILKLKEKILIFGANGILEPRYFHKNYKKKFLHIHAGTLPAFRGSTTCYYEILELGRIGVCAMFLKAKLDLGEILIQRHFSIQNLQALRAKKLKKIPKLKEPFYKIHPVLKNIAILKLCVS